jgi:hypothetical protein
MIAGPNRVRHALNRRARALLKANGQLTGPAVTVGDREFCVGDWVVTRKNARHLRSPDGAAFVKNGSHGRVIDLDAHQGWLTVEFKSDGAIRLPAYYVSAGWVEHGYARTTYGVQSVTLRRALYHVGPEASFEEGYVALTRAAEETRVYLVDGARPADDEVAHRGHEEELSGLATVCQSLERRRAKDLAHHIDPLAAQTADTFAGWSLDDLAAEGLRLERILAAAPSPVDRALSATERQRDDLMAARRAWEQRRFAAHGSSAGSLAQRLVRRDAAGRVAREIERLDRRLRTVDERLDSLRCQHDRRRIFFAEHAEEANRLQLVRRAQDATHLQTRVRGRLDLAQRLHAQSGVNRGPTVILDPREVGWFGLGTSATPGVAKQAEGAGRRYVGAEPDLPPRLPLADREAEAVLDLAD